VPHRHLALLAAFVSALLVSMPAAATPMPGNWSTPARAWAVGSKPAHSMAADPLGNVHIAVAGSATGGIKYITNAYGPWHREQVTTNADLDPSIAVDADGYAYIAFARTDGVKGIYVASNATGYWVVDLRHAGADRLPSIAIRDGHVHLAFKTAAGSLMYLSNSTGTWQSHVVEAGCCAGSPSLRLTSTGLVRIAYSKLQSGVARALRFASRNGSGAWSLQTIDASASNDPTLALGQHDDPYVIYVRHLGGTYWTHREATGSIWTPTRLDSASHMKPDMEVYYANFYMVYGTTQTLYFTTFTSGYLSAYVLSNTHKDSNPEFEGSRIIFNKSGTTSGDGIYFTHN
jgi:hypothetical protein